MSRLEGDAKMKARVGVRRTIQALLCAGLLAAVGCHLPITGRLDGATHASRVRLPGSETLRTGGEGVILEVDRPRPLSETERAVDRSAAGTPAGASGPLPTLTLPGGLVETQAPLPAMLKGREYGKIGFAIRWPDLSQARYKAQFIPQAAQSIRVRVVGSDGKNRLSVMFFREDSPSNTLTQAAAFFLPVEAGLLVEVRAYGEKRAQLQTIPAGSPNSSPYNPDKFPEYDMKGKRVLAEGFQFNVQVSLLSKTPVRVELDSSQLVAGIGGSPGINGGGDPYYDNFYSTARFAEMWDPARVWYDKGKNRLYWVEFPVFKLNEDPKERDIVRMLNGDGLTGAKDNDPAALVMSQVAGGDRPRLDENGDGNQPDCATLNGINDLFWYATGPGGNKALYIAEASSSFLPGRIRRILPPDNTGTVQTDPGFRVDSQTPRDYIAVTGALGAVDDVLAIEGVSKTVVLDNSFARPLLGAGTESISATESKVVDRVGLTSPTRLAAMSSTDFLVINGPTLARVIGGSVRIKVGGGETPPTIGAEIPDASQLSLSLLTDVKYDPVLTDGGAPVAYLADQGNSVVWRLKLGATLASAVKAKAIRVNKPTFLAVSPSGGTVYSMDDQGEITRITIDLQGVDSTESVNVGRFGGARGMAVGQDAPGVDRLYVAFPTTITTFLANSGLNGTRVTMFGRVDKNDLAVGDCANIASVLSSNGSVTGNPVPAPVTLKRAANLTKPSWLSTDATGDLYISDTGNNRIRKVTLNDKGAPIRIASLVRARPLDPSPTLTLDSPQGVDVDEWGNVFIADTNNSQILVWRPCNGLFAEGVASPLGQVPIPALLPIAGTGTKGLNFDNINATLAQLSTPKAVRVERYSQSNPSRRRVFFIDQGNRVRMLTPFYPSVTAPSAGSRSWSSAPICPSPAGADADNYFKYIISTIAGAGDGPDGPNAAQAKLSSPSDLAIDQNGYVYVADGNRVRRIDPITGSISTIYTAPGAITSLSLDEVRSELYFTLSGQQSIRKVFLGN